MPCDAQRANTIGLHYPASNPDHALVVVPGEATDRVALDVFCTHHAGSGVDVWLIDVGVNSTQAWAEAIQAAGHHVAETVGLPAFVHGSGSRTPVAQAAVNSSELLDGAVLLLDSAAAGQVTLPASHNAPPILYVVAGWDTDADGQLTEAVAAATALPVELDITPSDFDHVLADDYAAHSDTVLDWCLREVSNHLRDGLGRHTKSGHTPPAVAVPTRRCL